MSDDARRAALFGGRGRRDDGGSSSGGGGGSRRGPAAAPPPAPTMADIDRTRARTTAVLADAVRTARETEDIAAATLTELDSQSETLKRTHRKAQQINADVKRANWMLRGMKNIRGYLYNALFSKPPPQTAVPAPTPIDDMESRRRDSSRRSRSRSGGKSGSTATASTTAKPESVDDMYLDELLESSSRLKEMAATTGDVVAAHNQTLDEITTEVDRANVALRKANRAEKRLLR